MIPSLVIVLLIALLGIGVPVGFATAIAGSVGLWIVGGWGAFIGVLRGAPLAIPANNVLATIPMFILMAEFILRSGIITEVFDALDAWLGGIRGGLGIVTILTGAGFAAVSGSSTAAAAAMAPTVVPQMVGHGYQSRFASGLVAVAGTLAIMIPPSNGLILYAVIGNVDIGKMLIAGVVPGLLNVVLLILCLQAVLWFRPDWARRSKKSASWKERILLLRGVGPIVALVLASIGLIYLGIATPTEAGSLGAFGAFIILTLKKRLTWSALFEALVSTAQTSAMIMMIIIGAHITGYFLTLSQASQHLVTYLQSSPIPRYGILACILALHLVLGLFMEQISILVLLVPITLPIIVALGFNPIWYGILNTLLAEIGLVMPPIGLNLFVISRYTDQSLGDIFGGVIPFLFGLGVLVLVLVAFPQVSLWLPSHM